MQRLLSIRALGLGVVALALMAAMGLLGQWQLRVYDDHQRARAQALLGQPVVPLDRVLGPDEAFPGNAAGRPVAVRGVFLAAEQVYVRAMPGAPGRYAVVTPLRTASGSAVLVVRGAVSTLRAAQVRAPGGRVTVRGYLEPAQDEGFPPNGNRVMNGLSVAALVSTVGPDLYSGYVLQRAVTPARSPALLPVAPTLPDPSRWSGMRNLFYAFQWWLFAAFVAFMWWRITDPETLAAPSDAHADTGADRSAVLR